MAQLIAIYLRISRKSQDTIALTWHYRMTTGKLAAAPSECTRLHNAGLSAMGQPYGARPARSSRITRRSTRAR